MSYQFLCEECVWFMTLRFGKIQNSAQNQFREEIDFFHFFSLIFLSQQAIAFHSNSHLKSRNKSCVRFFLCLFVALAFTPTNFSIENCARFFIACSVSLLSYSQIIYACLTYQAIQHDDPSIVPNFDLGDGGDGGRMFSSVEI